MSQMEDVIWFVRLWRLVEAQHEVIGDLLEEVDVLSGGNLELSEAGKDADNVAALYHTLKHEWEAE